MLKFIQYLSILIDSDNEIVIISISIRTNTKQLETILPLGEHRWQEMKVASFFPEHERFKKLKNIRKCI